MTVFAGTEGDLQKNNFHNLTNENPFLSSRIELKNSFFNRFYGGIKGNFQGFDYRAQITYEDVDNLALYVVNQDSVPRFNVLYDTANVITISGEILFPAFEGFDVIASVAQRIYDLDNQDKPWHLPALTLNTGLIYSTPDGKFRGRVDFFLENGVPFRTEDGGSDNLNALFDISAGGEYMFTEQIGAYARLNNLFNNKRQRWRYYPTLGINALVGITAKF